MSVKSETTALVWATKEAAQAKVGLEQVKLGLQ